MSAYSEISKISDSMQNNIKMKDELRKKKEKLLNEISMVNIKTRLSQEEIISNIHEDCKENNMVITKINFTDAILAEPDNDIDSEILVEGAVAVGATIEFKGNYYDMLLLIDDIKDDNMSVSINNIRLLLLEDGGVLGTIDLNYYAMPN